MKLGITGTQTGMKPKQMSTMIDLLMQLKMETEIEELHHGDCIGADAEFVQLVRVGFPGATIVSHPCTITDKRARVPSHIEHPAKPPLERNHDIVDAAELMFAAPKTMNEELRSGTWATIRYARKQKKHLIIVWPDGTYT
jgi:hypothetical protein